MVAALGLTLLAGGCADKDVATSDGGSTAGADDNCGNALDGCELACPVPTQIDWVVFVNAVGTWPLVVGGEGEVIVDADPGVVPASQLARLDTRGVLTPIHDLDPGDNIGWRWGERLVTFGDWSGGDGEGWDYEVSMYEGSATPIWTRTGIGFHAPPYLQAAGEHVAVFEDALGATDSRWVLVDTEGTPVAWPDEAGVVAARGNMVLGSLGLYEVDGHELLWSTADVSWAADFGTDAVARLAEPAEGDQLDLELRSIDGTVRWRVATGSPEVLDYSLPNLWILENGDVMVFDQSGGELRFRRYRGDTGELCGASDFVRPPEVLDQWAWHLWAEPDGEGGWFFAAIDAVGHLSSE